MLKSLHYVLFALLLFSTTHLHSQLVLLETATEQSWAGGMCCAHGVNYTFELAVKSAGAHFHIDTIWINGIPKPFTSNIAVRRTVTQDSSRLPVQVQVGQRWDYRDRLDRIQEKIEETP